MAKKKSSGQKYKYRTRTVSRRTSSNPGSKKYDSMISGTAAGIGGQLLRKFLPSVGNYSQPAADILSGHFLKNDTLSTIGWRSIGSILAGTISGGSATSTSLIGGV